MRKGIEFYKYQGTGNDFVMIDDRGGQFDAYDHDMIARLCHRRYGIGADGLILVRDHHDADFEMLYFNADGKPASLCGNGSRCVVQFARNLGIVSRHARFMTVEGVLTASIADGRVSVKMPDVHIGRQDGTEFFLNTGSPHHVCFVEQGLADMDVYGRGREIRYSSRYQPGGTNVNFVEKLDGGMLYVRTYERGVENETYSCGTGVTAAALVHALKGGQSPVHIKTPGGQLEVSFAVVDENTFTDIYLTGPAVEVFRGVISL
jgi:diaminopimelate epimerase